MQLQPTTPLQPSIQSPPSHATSAITSIVPAIANLSQATSASLEKRVVVANAPNPKMTSAGVQSGITKPINAASSNTTNTSVVVAGSAAQAHSKENAALKDVTIETVTIDNNAYQAYVSKAGNFRTLYTFQAGLVTAMGSAFLKLHQRLNKKMNLGLFVTKEQLLKTLEETRSSYEKKCKTPKDTFLLNTVSNAIKSFITTTNIWEHQDKKVGFFLGLKPNEDWLKICLHLLNYLLATWIKDVGAVELFVEDMRAFKLNGVLSLPDPMFFNCLQWTLLRSGAVRAKTLLFETVTNVEDEVNELLSNFIPTLKDWKYNSVSLENLQAKDLVVYLKVDNTPVHVGLYVGKDANGTDFFESKFGFRNRRFHQHRLFDVPLSEGSLEVKALFFRQPSQTATAMTAASK